MERGSNELWDENKPTQKTPLMHAAENGHVECV